MADCYTMSFDLKNAMMDGYMPSFGQLLIYLRSHLVHTEFQFSHRYGDISFSFTMMDGCKGARFKKIGYSHAHWLEQKPWWKTKTLHFTDAEEDLIWKEACRMADVRGDFINHLDSNYAHNTCYYGPGHEQYDLIGLLTFADDKPNVFEKSKILAAIRPVLYCWAKYIRPDKIRKWCSKGICKLIQIVWEDFNGDANISPDGLDAELEQERR